MKEKDNMKVYCDEMNKIIKENKEDRVARLNEIMCKVFKEGGDLYWDRELYIDCNGDDDKIKELVRTSDKVHFEPSDDPQEHLGVVVRYNEPTSESRHHRFE